MKVKKGDKVKIIAGNEKGKTGTVIKVLTKEDKVIIDGLNLKKKHSKSRKEGEKGVIIEVASPIHISNIKKTEKAKKAEEVKK